LLRGVQERDEDAAERESDEGEEAHRRAGFGLASCQSDLRSRTRDQGPETRDCAMRAGNAQLLTLNV